METHEIKGRRLMFYAYVNQLPMVSGNSGLFRGERFDFECGTIRLVKFAMVYEREFIVKDKRRDILYHVRQTGLELRRGKKGVPPYQIRHIKNQRYGKKFSPLAHKNLDDRDDVKVFEDLIKEMCEEYRQRRSALSRFIRWTKDPVARIILTAGLVYGIVTALVLLT
jgi:hypothetical protein